MKPWAILNSVNPASLDDNGGVIIGIIIAIVTGATQHIWGGPRVRWTQPGHGKCGTTTIGAEFDFLIEICITVQDRHLSHRILPFDCCSRLLVQNNNAG